MSTLVRFREPLRNFSMNAEFERLINTVFESPARSAQAWTPPLDVWETEGDLVYAFDMPGIPEDKITVEIEDNTLTVSGSRERAEKWRMSVSSATSAASVTSRDRSLYRRAVARARPRRTMPTGRSKSTSRSRNSPSPAASR